MGTKDLFEYMDKYDIELDHHFDDILSVFPRQPWAKFINSDNKRYISNEALDFLDHLLVYDHQLRFTPREAMAHPYFDPVR
jgi:casein kinase II subunit alpha